MRISTQKNEEPKILDIIFESFLRYSSLIYKKYAGKTENIIIRLFHCVL